MRIVRPLNRFARGYSAAAASSSGSSTLPYVLGAAAVGFGAYYYTSTKPAAPKLLALSSDEFRTFKLIEVKKFNHNSATFKFELPEGTDANIPITSAVVVKSSDPEKGLNKNGKPKITPYTPVNLENNDTLEFFIKHYPGGVMTEHLFSLKAGDTLQIKGPIPKWPYKVGDFDHVGLVSGGAGITPIWQLFRAIADNPADKTKVTLVYANVSEEDIWLRKEFEAFTKARPDQFKLVFTLDKPSENWTGEKGYITKELLSKNLPSPDLGEKAKIFICGPPGQVNAISGGKKTFADQGPLTGLLADLGYKADQVYKF